MCGGGLRWKYVPTPQPGDAVRARVCRICGKRVKRPIVIHTRVSKAVPYTWTKPHEMQEGPNKGLRGWRPAADAVSWRVTERVIHTCCSREENQIERVGTVVRNLWSRSGDGSPKNFFLVVHIPKLGKRHWATLETVRLITPLEALADAIEETGLSPSVAQPD